jgi:hypothetical protein
MNIKVKAALEVVGFFVGASTVAILTRLGLDYLESIYGTKAVVNGGVVCLIAGAMYFIGSILYDIRVAQLKYKEKLNEMVKK